MAHLTAAVIGLWTLAAPTSVMSVYCRELAHRISPLIYGVTYVPRLEAERGYQWELGPSARRWGGNSSSRYNFGLGNAWNAGSDWFFRNLDYTGGARTFAHLRFLDENRARKVASALTLPMLGWVAKDRSSYAFSVRERGPQARVDPALSDAGDGVGRAGGLLSPPPPRKTSVPAPPELISAWVKTLREADRQAGARGVQAYILDNEPTLWSSTHRDVHPEPVSYQELLARTVAYGSAVRKADPEAVIAGPAAWGWLALHYSGVDAAAGYQRRPDRRSQGDLPLLPWYLRELRRHQERTGTRILDLVDVHFYPEGKGIGVERKGKVDPETALRRIRSTRSLWDASYRDESWIDEPIRLIPRLNEWIAQHHPGLGISIGEYSFGAEEHPSGGLAVAEALGRFGELGVSSAYYWTCPPRLSPAYWAFRAFRNFDGQGGRFLDWSVKASAPAGTSLFASRDQEGRKLVLVALNLMPDREVEAEIQLQGCGQISRTRAFLYRGGADALREEPGGALVRRLPPWSITVLELELQGRGE